MVSKRKFYITIFCVIAAVSTQARGFPDSSVCVFNNSVILSGSNFSADQYRRLGAVFLWRDDNIGVFYRRTLTKHFYLKAGYNQWNNLWRMGGELVTFQSNLLAIGTMSSLRYKMGDIYGGYTTRLWRRHYISLGMGVSYTKGTNIVIDSIHYNPDPPFDGYIYQSPRYVAYWGIVPEASYDFLFLRKRLGIGVDVRYRRYFGFYYHHIEYGFHTAFNF